MGKTWLMKEFGKLYFADTIYINFDSNAWLSDLFSSDLDPERLITGLEIYAGRKINPENTLFIFDEIQEVPRALSRRDFQMMTSFRKTYIDALKYYYYVGGMPEAALSFSEEKDFNEVRSIQKRILDAYEQDFSKHAPVELVPKIRMLWNSIPSQLAKENKKFIYGLLREGARAKEYETAIMWLSDCGLIHKVSRVNTIGAPVKSTLSSIMEAESSR